MMEQRRRASPLTSFQDDPHPLATNTQTATLVMPDDHHHLSTDHVHFVNQIDKNHHHHRHCTTSNSTSPPTSILLGRGGSSTYNELWYEESTSELYRILGCSTITDADVMTLDEEKKKKKANSDRTSKFEAWEMRSLTHEQIMERLNEFHEENYDNPLFRHKNSYDDNFPPYVLDHLQSKRVADRVRLIKISSGSIHSLFLTDDGFVYAMGRGADGQLLNYNSNFKIHGDGVTCPTMILWFVERGIRIRDIVCGGWFSAFITTDGDLYTVGRFGLDYKSVVEPVLRHGPSLLSHSDDEKSREWGGRVETFGAGNEHLIFQCEMNAHGRQVYGLGNNSYGQLGTADTTPREKSGRCFFSDNFSSYTPGDDTINGTEASALPQCFNNKHRLLKIGGGERFSAVLTSDHQVYLAGMVGEAQSDTHFRKVDFRFIAPSVQITDFACSWNGILFVDSMKRIFNKEFPGTKHKTNKQSTRSLNFFFTSLGNLLARSGQVHSFSDVEIVF